jgi:hypothetical protein
VLGRNSRRLTVLAVATAVVSAAPAAAYALGSPIGPNQYFAGSLVRTTVTGTTTVTTSLLVACSAVGAGTTGHPLPGQAVEVALVVPNTSDVVGYTGSLADSIEASVIFGTQEPPISENELIGTLTDYNTLLTVSPSLTVPCSGPGQLSFTPEPYSAGAESSTVDITFVSSAGG